VQTQWGEVPVRDAHVHFFSRNFFQTLAAQRGNAHEDVPHILGWEAPDADAGRFAHRWVAELDRHHVASASIIASVPGDEDSVAAAVHAVPDRFHGYFFVDPTQSGASERVTQYLSRGLQGICLFPAMHRYSLHDERVRAVIASAAAHPGTIVFVSCGVLTVGFRKKLGMPSKFDIRFANPVDLHAIAQEFPTVPFVIPHFGAGFFREALMVADLCPNVYLDTSGSNSWIRYQAPEPSLREVFRRALEVAGPKRLLFGTDSSWFPRGWVHGVFDEQTRVLYELALPAADVTAILGGNLERLLTKS